MIIIIYVDDILEMSKDPEDIKNCGDKMANVF